MCPVNSRAFLFFNTNSYYYGQLSLMRPIFILAFLFISFCCSAQHFTGEWKGYYTYDKKDFQVPEGKILITISIDSTGLVNSYTTFKNQLKKDTVINRKMSFEKINTDLIRLAELPDSLGLGDDLKTMVLACKQEKPLILSGKWERDTGINIFTGSIYLAKQPGIKSP